MSILSVSKLAWCLEPKCPRCGTFLYVPPDTPVSPYPECFGPDHVMTVYGLCLALEDGFFKRQVRAWLKTSCALATDRSTALRAAFRKHPWMRVEHMLTAEEAADWTRWFLYSFYRVMMHVQFARDYGITACARPTGVTG
jgi:hypothetical protein